MATTHLRQEDLGWVELLRLRVQNLASAPSSPAEGYVYYDSTLHQFGVYDGTDWVYLGDAASGLPSDWVVTDPAQVGAGNSYLVMNETATATGYGELFLKGDSAGDYGWASLLAQGDRTYLKIQAADGQVGSIVEITLDDGTPVFDIQNTGSVLVGGQVVVVDDDPRLTDERLSDFVGGMFSGNTETGITATYQDGDNTIDLVVAIDSSFISDFATAVDERARDAVGTALVAGNNIDITVNDGADTITIDVESLTSGDLTDFAEAVSDQVGTMVTGNTETGITVSYDDADNTLDFVLGALNTLPAPAADLSLAGFKITSLGTPTASGDAATKAYVDAAAVGIDWKASVRAATTAAGTLASSFENGDVIDGVTLATGDRILIKDQAAPADNGIYIVAASGAPARATDADTAAEVTSGMAVFVEEGTTNADSGWVLTTNGAITVGTTGLTFTQFTGLGQVTAGNALTKTGNTLDVAAGTSLEISSDTIRLAASAAGAGLTGGGAAALAVGAGTGITVNADDVAVDTAVVVRKYAVALTGGATSEVITHNLGTRNVHVSLRNNSTPWDEVLVDNEATTTNTVTLRAAANLPAGYIVTITA